MLDLWLSNGFEFVYTTKAIDLASKIGKVDVLEWWHRKEQENGLEFRYTNDAIHNIQHNRQKVMEWWNQSGKPIQISSSNEYSPFVVSVEEML